MDILKNIYPMDDVSSGTYKDQKQKFLHFGLTANLEMSHL